MLVVGAVAVVLVPGACGSIRVGLRKQWRMAVTTLVAVRGCGSGDAWLATELVPVLALGYVSGGV